MGVLNWIKHFFGPNIESGNVESNLKLYRIYSLLGFANSFVVIFITYGLNAEDPEFIGAILAPILFFAILITSAIYKNVAFIGVALHLTFVYITGFSEYVLHADNYSLHSFFNFFLIYLALCIVMKNHWFIMVYTACVLAMLAIGISLHGQAEMNTVQMFASIIMAGSLTMVLLWYRRRIRNELVTETARLRKNEKLLSALFNQTYDAILVVDYYSRQVEDCNEVALKLFEVEDESEIIGFTRDKFQVEALSDDELDRCRKELSRRGKWKDRRQYKTKSGRVFWGEETITPLNVDRRDCFILRIVDVTQSIEAEERMSQNEQQLSLILENIDESVYNISINEDGSRHIHYVSPQIRDIFGFGEEDYSKGATQDLLKMYHPEDLYKIQEAAEIIKVTKQPVNLIYRFKPHGYNEFLWMEEKVFPQYNVDNRHVANFGILRDVTERINAEQELKKSEERFRSLAANAPNNIAILAIDGEVIYTNRVASSLNVEDVVGKSMTEFIVAEEREAFVQNMQKVVEHDDVISFETRFVSDPRRWWSNQLGTIKNSEGKVDRLILIGSDVTERKQTQDLLQGMAAAANELFVNENIDDAISNSLTIIGRAVQVDRAYVFSIREDEKLGLLADQRFEWNVKHDKVLRRYERLQGIQLSRFQPLWDKLHANEVYATVADNPALEPHIVEHMNSLSITSIIIVPIFIGENLWGMIGFDDCTSNRTWNQYEQSTLLSFGTNIGSTIKSYDYQQSLMKSQASFRNLVDYSPDGNIIHFDGIIEYANPSATKLLGLTDHLALKGQHVADLFESEYRELIERRIETLKKGLTADFEEVKVKRPDGVQVDVGIQSVKTTYNDRPATQFILHDLSQQKELAREQLRAQVAEETNKQLEEEISERKKTQRALQNAQKFTRSIIDSSLDMIMATNMEDKITEFNQAAAQQFGYLVEEVIGSSPSILYANEEDHAQVRDSLRDKGTFSGEIKNKRKDGTEFTSYLAASMVVNEEGKVEGAMGVSRDVTERRRAQRKIQEQSAKIKSIFESSSHLIWSVNREKVLTSFNQNFTDHYFNMYGRRPQLMEAVDAATGESGSPFNRLWTRKYDACLSGEPQHFETNVTDDSGQEFWQEIFLHPIYGEDNTVIEVSGIGHDITYKKQAERKIKDQSAKIQSIFESTSHMMIWTLDKKFRITSFNKNFSKRFEGMFGVQPEIGQNFLEVIRPFISKDLVENAHTYYREATLGKAKLFEGPMIDKNDNLVWIETFLNPIYLEMGKIREISCLAHEITEKKNAERQIKQSLKEKEVLLKEVHHRVKNNLQVISSILNLQSSYVKDENTLEILKESQNRIKSMSFIHESLYQTKNFSSIDFSNYILNLSKNLVHSYRVYNDLVELKLDIDQVYLNLDQAIPCGLIVNELVSNALKYAFPESTEGDISIDLKQVENKLTLEVADTGIGLPEDFDYRNTDSLGLQLVVTLVEQLEGEIELDTTNGTKYIINFELQN